MSERDFFILMEQVFSLPKVAALVSQAADQQEDGGIPNRWIKKANGLLCRLLGSGKEGTGNASETLPALF